MLPGKYALRVYLPEQSQGNILADMHDSVTGDKRVNFANIDRHQVWIYLTAIAAGLAFGALVPQSKAILEFLVRPALGILLFTTFLQVPLLHIADAFRDRRFVIASLLGNFVLLPLLVWILLRWLPDDPALQLGVLLVLLAPCTDWFISFTQLGRGSAARAIAITPLNLLLQFLLLPVYLWLMLSTSAISMDLAIGSLLPSALALIGIPLLAAALTEVWLERKREGEIFAARQSTWRERLNWFPVPLLALVVFLIAGSQAETIPAAAPVLLQVVPVFVLFLISAALLGRLLTTLMRLPMAAGRTLAFNFGTRNSFVVLPIAIALPVGWEMAAIVIVLQSLVELFGMVFYLWWIPRHLFKNTET